MKIVFFISIIVASTFSHADSVCGVKRELTFRCVTTDLKKIYDACHKTGTPFYKVYLNGKALTPDVSGDATDTEYYLDGRTLKNEDFVLSLKNIKKTTPFVYQEGTFSISKNEQIVKSEKLICNYNN